MIDSRYRHHNPLLNHYEQAFRQARQEYNDGMSHQHKHIIDLSELKPTPTSFNNCNTAATMHRVFNMMRESETESELEDPEHLIA